MSGNKSFMASLLDLLEDDKFMKDVTSWQSYGTEKVDVTDYLSLVEKILNVEGDQVQNRCLGSPSPLPLSSTIDELCCLITCEALHAGPRQTMESLLDKLSSFSWDAKAVLALSAFSVYYAENRHLTQIENVDKKLRLAVELRGRRAGRLDLGEIWGLIRETLNFTRCAVEFAKYVIEFGALPISFDITISFYQIILGVIGCAVPLCGMTRASNMFPVQELSTFSNCFTEKYESFEKCVKDYKQENGEINVVLKQQVVLSAMDPLLQIPFCMQRSYEEIKKITMFGTDIVELMTKLICTKGRVYQCSTGKTVRVEELKSKSVMLLISKLDLSNYDLVTITGIYCKNDFRSSNYEIMWVPMVEDIEVHSRQTREQLKGMRSRMQWYACDPLVSKMAAKFIKEEWQYRQQTKVVVLNQQGKVVNMNAMTMIHLWGIKAFPFTEGKAIELQGNRPINWLELVVNEMVVPNVKQSFESNELIFIWDSAEDSETVTEIKGHIKKLESKISFSFKFFQIDKRDQFLCHLENCMSLKMQGNTKIADDLNLLELYNSYKKQSRFAIVARGSSVIVSTSLTNISKVLSKHEEWIKTGTNPQDFDTGFLEYFKKVNPSPKCYEFSIPNMTGKIPEGIPCPTDNCKRVMKNVVTFKCCHGEH